MVQKVGKAFQDDGKIGKQFQDGKAAKTAEDAPTGATDKHGDIGKEFKSDGAVVSMLQGWGGSSQSHARAMQQHLACAGREGREGC